MRRLIIVRAILAALLAVAAPGIAAAAPAVLAIYDFKGDLDGGIPNGGLVFDTEGHLYGTTNYEGLCLGCGTVFRLSPPTSSLGEWTEKVLYRFPPTDSNDGNSPYAGVIFGPSGTKFAPNLFGTTPNGGVFQTGTVFRILVGPATGIWLPVYIFGDHTAKNGSYLYDPVVFGADGALYGMTQEGGPTGGGIIFKLTPPTTPGLWDETVLYNFCNYKTTKSCPDGALPDGGLVINAAGELYGTTQFGGAYNMGVVFRLTQTGPPAKRFNVLYNFCQQSACSDGEHPETGVILDKSGALYGTTTGGGSYENAGVVFKLIPPPTGGTHWTYSVIHEFCSKSKCADGSDPNGGLIFDPNGALYGVTSLGGASGGGVVYKLVPGQGVHWQEQVLRSFAVYGSQEPANATGRLTIDNSTGTLYGGTLSGGYKSCDGSYCGTVFKVAQPSYHAP